MLVTAVVAVAVAVRKPLRKDQEPWPGSLVATCDIELCLDLTAGDDCAYRIRMMVRDAFCGLDHRATPRLGTIFVGS
jgi:hypothetical protein